jgi:hypothetical protein
MAIAVGATATTKRVRLTIEDNDGEEVIKTFELDGTVSGADIATFLGHLESLYLGGTIKASVSSEFDITGMDATPGTGLQPSVSHILGLTFEKVDPVNALKTARKGFIIPSYAQALKLTGGVPDVGDTDLAAVIAFLEAQLQFRGYNGTDYPGDFTYNAGRSGFGTATRRIDGLPG